MVVSAFTLDGLDDRVQRPRQSRRGLDDFGVLPRGSQCTDLERTESGKLRCVDFRRPRGWERLYRRIPGRPGFAARAQYRRVKTPEQVRAAIRSGGGYADLNNVGDHGRRAANEPLEGTRTMAKRHCTRFKRTSGGRRCAKFAGGKRSKGMGDLGATGKRKGRCLKRAKGGGRCLKRAK